MALPIDDLAREAFAALSRGDLDWLQRQYLTQDIRCHFPGGAPRPGTRGLSQALEFFGRAFELSGGTLRLEVRDVLASDEHAVPPATVHGGRARPAAGTPWRLYLPNHRWQADRGLEEGMKRAVRRTLLGVGLAGVVTAVTVAATVAPSWATPPVGLVNIALARGTNTSHGTIPLQFGRT